MVVELEVPTLEVELFGIETGSKVNMNDDL